MTNIVSKEILARLLAQENLVVTHANVETASFDVKNRELTLPLWDNMENYTYDHLVGHEVGHALYTPAEGWAEEVADKGMGFKTFLNVVEDARIEKIVQRRYPGLRRSFVQSYQKMMTENFFGADLDTINDEYELIDRLNVLFKCGESLGVRIEADEQVWVEELKNLETFEQAIDVARRLFELAKEKFDEKEIDDQYSNMSMSGDASGEEEDAGEETGASGDQSEQENGDATDATDADGNNGESDASSGAGAAGDESSEPVAKTDGALADTIREQLSGMTSGDVRIGRYNPASFNFNVVGYKEIAADFPELDYGHALLKKFQVNNKKAINYLVKEFEMKKRAAEYARTSTSKSGVIDTVKMNNYRFSDDIFSRISVVPEGKNHGLLMFVDWSGSMHDCFDSTIEQLMNLVMFCRQVNIPFRVFGFTDRWSQSEYVDNRTDVSSANPGDFVVSNRFALLELFSNKMNRREFQNAGAIAMILAGFNGRRWMPRDEYFSHMDRMPRVLGRYNLSGTPLDTTIMAAIKVHQEFQKENRLDIVNSIFLTDGESHDAEYVVHSSWAGKVAEHFSTRWGRAAKNFLMVGNKRYNIKDYDNCMTSTLMQMYRDVTGANLIGIRIMPKRLGWSDIRSALPNQTPINYDYDAVKKQLRKEKWMSIDRPGYSKSFLILDSSMKTSNGEIQVSSDAKKGEIKRAFSKSMGNKLESRKMLTEFIEIIS